MADFATVAELETFMGTVGLGTRGTAMLGHASVLIRRTCGGQALEVVTGRQEEFAGSDDTTLFLTQRPVTAVSALTIDAVAFSDFEWTRWGTIVRNDEGEWSVGPIVVTYDSGYTSTEVEFLAVKTICLEVAARALGGPTAGLEQYGTEVPELRGAAPGLFLTEEERMRLIDFGAVPVG